MISTPTRRLTGVIALVCALLLMLIIPRMLQPDLAGIATAEPLPAPPLIGTCVVVPESVTDQVADSLIPVPCDSAHDGEVVWAPRTRDLISAAQLGESTPPSLPQPGGVSAASSMAVTDCSRRATEYVGGSIADRENSLQSWQPIPPYWTFSVVKGPSSGFPERLGWFACLVRPSADEPYLGSVRGDGDVVDSRRPGAFATCLAPGEEAIRSLQFTSCSSPHRIEFIASLVVTQAMADAGRVDVETSADELLQQCRAAVSVMTGNPDASYGGRLSISAESISQRGFAATTPDPGAAVGQLILPDCLVELVGDGLLTDSVIGLGISALPVS